MRIMRIKKMHWILVLFAASVCVHAQVTNQIHSDVYSWKGTGVNGTTKLAVGTMVHGVATDFSLMSITKNMMGKAWVDGPHAPSDIEQMIIVKDGRLKITINGKGKTVGRGSVAIIMPGDTRSFSNAA